MVPWGARGTNRAIGLDSLSWVTSFGADYNPYLDDNGVWQQGYIQPEYKDMVVFMKDLVANNIFDNEYVTTEHQAWIEGLSSGKYMFWYDNPTFAAQVNAALSTIDPDARFEPIPILENPYGYVRNYQQPTHYTDTFYFSSETEDPELLVKFMNWSYGEEGMYTFNYGQEGYSYTLDGSGQPQWTQEILDLYKDNENAYYAVQSDLGVLNNNFSPSWLNLSVEIFRQSESGGERAVDARFVHDFYKENPNIYEKTPQPPLSEEQSTRIQEINRDIKDLVDTELNKFIMGLRPIEEYDAFMADMVSRGAQEIADILTEAEKDYQAQIGG
jgi:ABC-type glycerol-3-phosphate transport system substrate-binding protein